MITRSQAQSRQPRDRVASSGARPPRRVSPLSPEISQHPHEGHVVDASVSNTGTAGGRSADSAEGNSRPAGQSRKCRSDCQTCPALNKSSKIISNSTGREFYAIDIEPNKVHCKLQNYIYLLTCNFCNIQYVGESVIHLNLRMNIHRKGKTGCEVLIDHFSNVCCGCSFRIQILEKLPGDGYCQGNKRIDDNMRKYRLEREDHWIKTLRTVYPYGLNDRTKSMNSDVPIGQLFPPLPRHGTKFVDQRTRTHRNSTSSHSDLDAFMQHLESIDITSRSNSCRKILDGFKQKHLRKLAKESNKRLDNCDNFSKRWFDLIIDIYFSKVFKDETKANSKKAPKYILPIFFDNKGLEFIRLNSILRNDEVKAKLPDQFRNDETPSVVTALAVLFETKSLTTRILSRTSTQMTVILLALIFILAIARLLNLLIIIMAM